MTVIGEGYLQDSPNLLHPTEMIATLALFVLVAISLTEARIDPCKLPIEPGLCRAYMPRWGYDQESGECVRFIYGGCGGNKNHFHSKEQCENMCGR
ncbi:unnamed protein product [Taenia asiatica]|uniref:BPTI/Kunitz inhibitor domain-containing protein n=1 Tax=Taenia asiatica TaxID=60517 RepID=A0A0R3WBP8_TAEAS|nr:unnamed protein product [Taenia asiatica]